MDRLINWARQNLVTVFEVGEIAIKALNLILVAAARLVAFTPSTNDDQFVAKLHDGLKRLEKPFKSAKAFLLGTDGQ